MSESPTPTNAAGSAPVDAPDPATAVALRGARWAARIVGLVLPLVTTLILAVLLVAWLPRMPAHTAVHWNAAGEADGFASPALNAVLFPVVSLLYTALYFVPLLAPLQARLRQQPPQQDGVIWGPMHRLMPALTLGMTLANALMALLITVPQLDLADGSDLAPNPWIGLAMLTAPLIAVPAYFVQPRLTVSGGRTLRMREPLKLSATERIAWVGTVEPSKPYLWVAFTGLAALVAVSLIPVISGEFSAWGAGLLWGLSVLTLGLLAVSARFTVRIDSRGLEVRSALGWPRLRVPPSEIVEAGTANILPFGEFGGWGWRLGVDGRTGIVMRAGDSLVVKRHTKKDLVITIDGAADAAAVLTLVAAQHTQQNGTEND